MMLIKLRPLKWAYSNTTGVFMKSESGTQKRQAQGRAPAELRRGPGSPAQGPGAHASPAGPDLQARRPGLCACRAGRRAVSGKPCRLRRPALAALTNYTRKQRALLSAPLRVKVAHSSGQHSHQNVVSFTKWFLVTELAPEV